MRNLKNRFLGYVLRDRRTPNKNREHVGQNLMLLAIFLFFIFLEISIDKTNVLPYYNNGGKK